MPRSLANSGCDKSVPSQSETSRLHRSLVSSFTLVLLRNRGGSPRQIIGARRPSSAGYEGRHYRSPLPAPRRSERAYRGRRGHGEGPDPRGSSEALRPVGGWREDDRSSFLYGVSL